MGGKNARKKFFFQKHTDFASKQRWKNNVLKSAKIRFLKTHKYCYKKMGEKNARNNFSRNTRISQAKNDGKKSSGKSAKTRFFKHTKIVTENRGKKTRGKNFQKTHE